MLYFTPINKCLLTRLRQIVTATFSFLLTEMKKKLFVKKISYKL